MPGYAHSIPVHSASRPGGAPAPELVHRLASNENPHDPLPGVSDAAIAAAKRFNRYPDLGCERLIDALARGFDLPPTRFATGTGSVGVAQSLIQAMAAPGDEVMYAWRSFEAYPVLTAICGATAVEVPLLNDADHDLNAMAERVTARTRLIFICTPNNPTGTAVRRDELVEFLDRVPENVLVVLDEAYIEFVRDKDAADGATVCREYPNLAVLRTFSKAFGLAGLRIGYAIAPEPVAAALRMTAVPFGVSQIGQEAAIASLAAADELMKRVDTVVAERHRMEDALIEQGWPISRSQANFVWLPLRERSAEFADVCAHAGIAVRALAEDGVRVTIGSREANDLFLATAARIRPEHDR